MELESRRGRILPTKNTADYYEHTFSLSKIERASSSGEQRFVQGFVKLRSNVTRTTVSVLTSCDARHQAEHNIRMEFKKKQQCRNHTAASAQRKDHSNT